MGKRAGRRQRSKGGALVLKEADQTLRKRVREVSGEKVGIVPIDVAKQRVCAMITDFYGTVLAEPEVFPVTAGGLGLLDRRIAETQAEKGLKFMVIGLEQTGRLHEPVRRALGRHWEVKMVHPLVTNHLRKGFSRSIKTEGMDVDALARAVIGCYGTEFQATPVAYQRWQMVHRVREQLVDERSALKVQMHERIHAVLPGLSAQFDNIWSSPLAMLLVRTMHSPAMMLDYSIEGLSRWCREQGVRCTRSRAEKLLSWAADATPPCEAATTEAEILAADTEHLALLTQRIEGYERQSLQFLVEAPYVVLMSASGISHVLAGGLGAEAGPMQLYATASNLSGRAGLYPRRYQSDETDVQDCGMAHGHPFLRDVLIKSGHCLTMPKGAFFAWAESRRSMNWCEQKVAAVMANRYCRIAHAMVLKGETFRHPDARPGVSVLGKLLNVAADLGIEAEPLTQLATQAAYRIPVHALGEEVRALDTGAWKKDNRPREHGASACTTRQISQTTVPMVLDHLRKLENNDDVEHKQLDHGPLV